MARDTTKRDLKRIEGMQRELVKIDARIQHLTSRNAFSKMLFGDGAEELKTLGETRRTLSDSLKALETKVVRANGFDRPAPSLARD